MNRWLNDHLIWQTAWEGLGEEQIAERLDHMYLTPSSGPSLADRLSSLADLEGDLAVRFRRGELRGSEGRAAPGSGSLTAAGLLAAMYNRVDPRLRPYILKESRRMVVGEGQASSGRVGESFILHAEILMMKIVDGVVGKEVQDYISGECTSALTTPVPGLEPPSPLPWTASCPDWAYACTGPLQTTGGEGQAQGAVLAPIMSSYLRMVVHGVASFYGVRAESVPLSQCQYSWAGAHGQVGGSTGRGGRRGRGGQQGAGGNEPLVLKLILPNTDQPNARLLQEAVPALRRSLAADMGSSTTTRSTTSRGTEAREGGEEGAQAEASSSTGTTAELLPPLVPLLQVHVSSITRGEGPEAAAMSNASGRPLLRSGQAGQFSYGKQYKGVATAASRGAKVKGKGSVSGASTRSSTAGGTGEKQGER